MMRKEDIIYISCVPYDNYFVWQVEVQVVHFRELGISSQMEILIWHLPNSDLSRWELLKEKYPEVKFWFYVDSGVNLGLYIPQLRPHSLKKHFKEHASRLSGRTFFYHDTDILFRELPDFDSLLSDNINYVSDTIWYTGSGYLRNRAKKSKRGLNEFEVINKFSEVFKVPVETILKRNSDSGGAQYLLKNIDYKFWEDVEAGCLWIRNYLFYDMPNSINRVYFDSEADGYQSWCADMWSILYNLWNRGQDTRVTDELSFCMPIHPISTYNSTKILHNAGVTPDRNKSGEMFYKGAYIHRFPYEEDFSKINKQLASSVYVEAIKKVSCPISQ